MSDVAKRYVGQQLPSSLPFQLSPYLSSSSFTSLPLTEDSNNRVPLHFTVPWIRELNFGQSIAIRSKANDSIGLDLANNGSPDLIHWGKYYGNRSSLYLNNDFDFVSLSKEGNRKDDDGYIGFYHYANGISFYSREDSVEQYITQVIGLVKKEDGYHWKKDISSENWGNFKREMIVTYCCYNIFNKSDFRAKFIIHTSRPQAKYPVTIDRSYTITPNTNDLKNRRTHAFNANSIKQLSVTYWEELNASSLIRLFAQLDNPSSQLTGLVSFASFTNSQNYIIPAIKSLVKFLPRGQLTEMRQCHGVPTGSGSQNEGSKKINYYRNTLIDALIRLVELDISGKTCDVAIKEIRRRYYIGETGEWDIVILRLLKAHIGENKEQEYLNLIHRHLLSQVITTQLAIILIEQIKFLISKQSYDLALKISEKCVRILPLDFDSWYYLALCSILTRNFEKALVVMNKLPVVTLNKQRNSDIELVCGIKDVYISTFATRLSANNSEVISEKTFDSYFPLPKVHEDCYSNFKSNSTTSLHKVPSQSHQKLNDHLVEEGSIKRLWHDLFIFNPHLRHPFTGNQFYHSPLMSASTAELSSVDPSLIKAGGPNASKSHLAAQSAGTPTSSILDFDRTSTWGRCYDLLSLFVAIIGWDNLVSIKERTFQSRVYSSTESVNQKEFIVNHNQEDSHGFIQCETWLEQLFLVIYEDLRLLMTKSNLFREDQQHSALEWEMMGLLGWSAKYKLKESISSIMTSVMGVAAEGGFDYFGTIKLLEIYDEFVLSDTNESNIDLFSDDYENKTFSNKIILRALSPSLYLEFSKSLAEEYLTLDFILFNLMRLISWNLRWYQYTPNYLVVKVLTKLCVKYDLIFVRGKFRVVYEQNKKNNALTSKPKVNKFSLGSLFSSPKEKPTKVYEFTDGDTIIDYTERLISWIDELRETNV